MQVNVFLERTFDAPLTVEQMLERSRSTAWCMELYKVDWEQSFLAMDGRQMVCWLRAIDAESARNALRKGGADTRILWVGTVHDGLDPAAANVLVERRFDAPVALEEIQSREDAASWCLEAYRVKFARTLLSQDRKRMLCLYQAPDAESVRAAQREAGMPFEAVWAFQSITPAML